MSRPGVEELRHRMSGMKAEHRAKLLREARRPWSWSVPTIAASLISILLMVQAGGQIPRVQRPGY